MRTSTAFLLAIVGFTSNGILFADDKKDDKKTEEFAKLIVAKWEITKAGGSAPAGTQLHFDKDNNVTMILKMDAGDIEAKGTYKLAKDKLTLRFDFGGMESEETLTIKKLKDDAMELEDKDGGVDVLKKVK